MSAKVRHFHVSDPGWQIRIRNYLRAGFGVEDISIKLRDAEITPNEPHHVRDYVSHLRETGALVKVVRRKKNDREKVST